MSSKRRLFWTRFTCPKDPISTPLCSSLCWEPDQHRFLQKDLLFSGFRSDPTYKKQERGQEDRGEDVRSFVSLCPSMVGVMGMEGMGDQSHVCCRAAQYSDRAQGPCDCPPLRPVGREVSPLPHCWYQCCNPHLVDFL